MTGGAMTDPPAVTAAVEPASPFRVYLGAAAGSGKTIAMLGEGQRRRSRGADVVIAFVESHGRPVTEQRMAGLEVVPALAVAYRGSTFGEMDTDGVLRRHPQVALVDELAHTNVPGSGRNAKRWQDITELLDAGIAVITTVNIQHLDSVADTVERITGVPVRERVPDWVVRRAARDLGISTPIPNEATIALGTSTVSLLELTSAYAAVANEAYPVSARGLETVRDQNWYENLTERSHPLTGQIRDEMLDLLSASAETGTGRQAALSVDTYGKTGTTQDNRDALFLGFANGLVCGVWVGNDDNSPNPGLSGGGIPARVWRDFMQQALGVGPKVAPEPVIDNPDDPDNMIDPDAGPAPSLEGVIDGLGLNLHIGRDGSIDIKPSRHDDPPPPQRRDDRAPPRERDDEQ